MSFNYVLEWVELESGNILERNYTEEYDSNGIFMWDGEKQTNPLYAGLKVTVSFMRKYSNSWEFKYLSEVGSRLIHKEEKTVVADTRETLDRMVEVEHAFTRTNLRNLRGGKLNK